MATAAGRHRASSQAASSPTMGYYHSQPTQGDMELLDLLTREDSAFPHASSSSALSSPSSSTFPSGPVIAGKPRPLATLAALRRPPIDPIILAASLSSGPHVTRHHFHHSYGDKGHSKHSRQMPASQRKAAAQSAEASSSQSAGRQTRTRAARSQSITGSYTNCDLDDGDEEDDDDEAYAASSAAAAGTIVEPSLADKYPERTLYPSKQAPRSVRLKLEQEEKAAQEAREAAATGLVGRQREGSSSLDAAHAAEVAQSTAVRASNEEQSDKAPNASAPREDEATHGTKALLDRALSERQAIVSAPPTPPLSSSLQHDPFAQPQAPPAAPPALARLSSIVRPPPLIVRCYARTRIPTPHGEIFCHLYKNNHDAKEHMALVVDPAQNEPDVSVEELLKASRQAGPRPLRSRTLDEVWGSEETDMERIVRGAYVGRLGPGCQVASRGPLAPAQGGVDGYEPPLVRIHSECYTGETIGSQRCDCGEQLDEALRLILSSGTGHEPATDEASSSSLQQRRPRLPRGVVVYMRQEGRGIGLLDKLMAYNLQDMGHDTVSANVLLGHLPDARRYNIASAILQDLGIHECRLLTNNPEKMEALESEGIPVKERVPMVPRAWLEDVQRSRRRSKHKHKRRQRKEREMRRERQPSAAKSTGSSSRAAKHNRIAALGTPHSDLSRSILSQAASLDGHDDDDDDDDAHRLGLRHQGSDVEDDDDYDSQDDSSSSDEDEYQQHLLRSGGATMIGGSATRSVELDRYLRTKIEKMGHLLDLPQSGSAGGTPASPSGGGGGGRSAGGAHRHDQTKGAASTRMARGASGAGAEEDDGHGTGTESLLDEEELRRLAVDDDQENSAA